MIRNATAVWNGSGKEGNGHLTTQSTTLNKTQYSYLSRFEQGVGTNPEELVAAAHEGCFTMNLCFLKGNSWLSCLYFFLLLMIIAVAAIANTKKGNQAPK